MGGRRLAFLLVAILPTGCAVTPGPEPRTDDAPVPVTDLADVLVGEYTNHAQVWAARRAGRPAPPSYLVTISPLAAQGTPQTVLRFRQFRAGDSAGPVREARFLLSTGAGDTVIQEVQRRERGAWRTLAGCRVLWERRGGQFRGETRGEGCRFRTGEDGGEFVVRRTWTAGPEGLGLIETRESGDNVSSTELALEPVRWYTGWAGVRSRGEGATGEWRVERRVRLHDGGGESRLPRVDGRDYAMRLERLTWPRSGINMLRLSVVDPESGEVVAYAWAPPGADSIGIHLGWLQAGFAAAEGDAGGPVPLDGGEER